MKSRWWPTFHGIIPRQIKIENAMITMSICCFYSYLFADIWPLCTPCGRVWARWWPSVLYWASGWPVCSYPLRTSFIQPQKYTTRRAARPATSPGPTDLLLKAIRSTCKFFFLPLLTFASFSIDCITPRIHQCLCSLPTAAHFFCSIPCPSTYSFFLLPWAGSENLMDCRYNVMLTILTYFLPICAMGYAYFQVGVELWGSQGIGECTDHQMENVRSKRRVNNVFLIFFRLVVD